MVEIATTIEKGTDAVKGQFLDAEFVKFTSAKSVTFHGMMLIKTIIRYKNIKVWKNTGTA